MLERIFEQLGHDTDKGTSIKTGLQAFTRSHQVALFFLLTIAFTWTTVGIYFTTGLMAALPIGVLGPLLAAAFLTWATGGSPRQWAGQVLIWRHRLRWYLIAFGLPAVFVAGATVLVVAWTGDTPQLGLLPERTAYLIGTFFFTLFLGAALEEFGWRGFALPRLQERYSALMASVVIGVVWALWHAPLFFIPGTFYTQISPALYLVMLIGLSVIFTWVYNSTGGSVLLAMILHAAWNVSMVLYPWDVDPQALQFPFEWNVAMTVLPLAVAVLLVVVYGGSKLANRETIPGTEHTGGVPANQSNSSEGGHVT